MLGRDVRTETLFPRDLGVLLRSLALSEWAGW